jgi:excisionase family DNA binding protein
MAKPLIGFRGVGERLHVSHSTVKRLVREGELEPIRIGRSVRFAEEDVDALIMRRRNADAAPARTASSTSTPTTDWTGRDVEDEV